MSAMFEMRPYEFRLMRQLFSEHCGIYPPEEAMPTFARKLAKAMQATQAADFTEYYHLLKYGDGLELERAVDAIVNNETYFFREIGQIEAILDIVRDAPAKARSVRILSAGCSTGEEPYTIAMLLHEAGLFDVERRVEIHGVDISSRALEKARHAKYTSNSFRSAEGRYLDWYFKPVDGVLRIDEALRRRVSFSQANLVDTRRMRSLGMFDIVLCRNVMIYFDAASRLRALDGLIGVTREAGHLFVGHSESLFNVTNTLEMVQVGKAIGYRKPVDMA
ncbi:MAG: protein-glutamate O-methyltransferase CheR [Clostridiales bacterium]|nr:protein-glutamate O-methyltransferase CheR [Clostridiales bacterium]